MWIQNLIILSICLSIEGQTNVCNNQAPGSFVSNPQDCQVFYLCLENNNVISAFCPAGKLFNTDLQLCDAAENVNCLTDDVMNVPNTAKDQELKDASKFCQSLAPLMQQQRLIYITSGHNCSVYYMCYYGQALKQECSVDLHWNMNTNKCDLPQNVQCSVGQDSWISMGVDLNNALVNTELQTAKPQTSTSNMNAANNPMDMIMCPNYGQHLFPHVHRCEFFIYCIKGQPTLQRCPFFRHFDVHSNSCQLQNRAVCVKNLQAK